MDLTLPVVSEDIEGVLLHLSNLFSIPVLNGDSLLQYVDFLSGTHNSILGVLNLEFIMKGEMRFDDSVV